MVFCTACSRSLSLGERGMLSVSILGLLSDNLVCQCRVSGCPSVTCSTLALHLPGHCCSLGERCIMWICNLAVSFVFWWSDLSIVIYPAQTLIQYMSVELLQLRLHLSATLLALHHFPCIAHPRLWGCIHRGSRRSYRINDS